MAAGNNNETQQDNQLQQQHYVIYGTGEQYSGNMVNVGGYLYTTKGGALEGDSLQLVLQENGSEGTDDNPVIRTFVAGANPRYRRSDTNNLVPLGFPLHEHADGTIMTEHSMGPNDNSVVVYIPENDIILDTEPPLTARMQAGGGGTTQDMSEQMDAPDTQTGGGGGTY